MAEAHFAAGSLPNVSLVHSLMRLGAAVTLEGSMWVDSAFTFLAMCPRPTQTVWSSRAMSELGKIKWETIRAIPAAEDDVVAHFEGCCPGHLSRIGLAMPVIYPSPRQVCWTTTSREGVKILSRQLRRNWSNETVKVCLQTPLTDVL